ncbi:hypothetical protein PSHT_16231 [Puccinia striiformis]|uniref:Uncharacterized protein n=1 Tax=Puccinia striiformis TaxID=27350 RepID=A0A2S4UB37_9BASI|nr:hypothetical protein PSHT_16231 [Puccinia striiformis]
MARSRPWNSGRNARPPPPRTVAQISRSYAAELAASSQSPGISEQRRSPRRPSSSLTNAMRRGSRSITRSPSPPPDRSHRRGIVANQSPAGSVRSTAATQSQTTRRRRRPPPWTILFDPNRPVATARVVNNEADIIRRFPGEIPNNQGLMDDTCESCDSLHWRGERTLNDRRKVRASYSTCCHKGNMMR